MEIYHKTSIARAQGIRLLGIIQETSQAPLQIIEKQSLQKFVQSIGIAPKKDLVSTLHSLDKQGKQMNKQYWGECISNALVNNQILTQTDIADTHIYIKALLIGNYTRPIMRFEQWDQNRELSVQQKQTKYLKIIELKKELPMYAQNLDISSFSSTVQKINFCLSIVTLDSTLKTETIQIYEQILKGNFIQVLRYCLTINIQSHQFLVAILKSLCYLFTAVKYDQLKKIIGQTFLFQQDTFRGLLQNLEDQRIQIKYYTFVIACMATYHIQFFADFIALQKQFLTYITNKIQQLTDSDGLLLGIQILSNLLHSFIRQPYNWQKQNEDLPKSIYNFGIEVLRNQNVKSWDTQTTCLRLLATCVKIGALSSENDLKPLSVVNNIFQDRGGDKQNENVMPLTAAALNIIRNCLLFAKIDSKSTMINDKNFETYFRNSLRIDHRYWYQHANILQIALILSRPEHSKFLFQKDLIQPLFQLSQSKNGCTKFYASQIILNLLQSALSSEWKITYLYEKKILNWIGLLLRQSFRDDEILTFHYNQRENGYFTHKQVFINCMKSLYLLTDDREKQEKSSFVRKCELYKKSFTEFFIDNFIDGIKTYFQTVTNKAFLIFNLRQKHELGVNNFQKFKMFKIMSTIVEQMTVHLRKRNISVDILRKIHKMRNEFLQNIYANIALHELEAQNIPIYIKLAIQIQGGQKQTQKIYRLSYSHLQYYISQLIKKTLQINSQKFRIKDKSENIQIKNQYDYRRLIDKILSDYSHSQFFVQLQKIESKDFGTNSLYMPGGGSPASRRMRPAQNPRIASTRMPQYRDVSPFGSQRIYNGAHNYNVNNPRSNSPRSNSPNFGVQCRKCGSITSNSSRLCTDCINRQNNFR